jgi:hypothetical protein
MGSTYVCTHAGPFTARKPKAALEANLVLEPYGWLPLEPEAGRSALSQVQAAWGHAQLLASSVHFQCPALSTGRARCLNPGWHSRALLAMHAPALQLPGCTPNMQGQAEQCNAELNQ